MKSTDLTILFLSCDKYSDLWKPLLYSFRKHWPDCPYEVRLGSNTITSDIDTILSGPDADWSSSLLSILKKIKTKYVFLWLDDIFPTDKIDAKIFSDAFAFVKKNNAKHMHIEPKPAPDVLMGNYGKYEKGAPYRSITFGFWEVDALTKLLIPGESPWNFEILGSYRASYSDGYYCTMKNIIPRIHVVEKGKIFREAYEYCMKHNIPLDVSKRAILASGFFIKSQIQKVYFNTLIKVPWETRLATMNMLRKLLISY